jgi:hypothetical protein
LSNPQKAFESVGNEFIDIMYPNSLSADVVVMLLRLGETKYSLISFIPEQSKDWRTWLTDPNKAF